MKEDTLSVEYDIRNKELYTRSLEATSSANKDWDVVGKQPNPSGREYPYNSFVRNKDELNLLNDEESESNMRSKAMLIIARKGGSERVWNRVMKRFISCVNKLGNKI